MRLRTTLIALMVLVALPALAAQDTLSVTLVAAGGTTPSLSAVTADTLMIANNGTMWLEIANSNGASRTATIVSQYSDYVTSIPAGLAASNQEITIPATTGNKLINLTNTRAWKDKSTAYTMIILSDTAGITAAAYKLE